MDVVVVVDVLVLVDVEVVVDVDVEVVDEVLVDSRAVPGTGAARSDPSPHAARSTVPATTHRRTDSGRLTRRRRSG